MDKAKIDAQKQVDAALAEADRLKAVAKDLEESNKKAETAALARIDALKESISSFFNERKVAEMAFLKAQNELTVKLNEKTTLVAEIKNRREDLISFENIITAKKTELKTVEEAISRIKEKHVASTTEKAKELAALEVFIANKKYQFEQEETDLKIAINKLKSVLLLEESVLAAKKEELKTVNTDTKNLQSDAATAEHRKSIFERDLISAENKLITVSAETRNQSELLIALKQEVEIVQTELRPLLAKRIESINFMKELENREANLKKKYEDVGLEYK